MAQFFENDPEEQLNDLGSEDQNTNANNTAEPDEPSGDDGDDQIPPVDDTPNNPPPPDDEPPASGSSTPPPPNPCSRQICPEDLGIQFGLEDNETGKNAQIRFLHEKMEKVKQEHGTLTANMSQTLANYRNDIGILVETDLIDLIDKVDQQRSKSLKRLQSHSEAIRLMLRNIQDQTRVNKILDLAINELDGILDEAREALQTFKNELSKSFQRRVLENLHQKHLEQEKQTLLHFLDQNQFEIDMERGFAYGSSARRFLGSNIKPDDNGE